MKSMIKGKGGLSEIVSYVLLIVIALGLAAGVYSWMKIYVPSEKEEKCAEDIALIIKSYECDTASKIISLRLENKGMFNVDGFYIKGGNNAASLPTVVLTTTDSDAVSSSTAGKYVFALSLTPGSVKIANFSYAMVSPLAKIRLQPLVASEKTGQLLSCENIITAGIDGCS